MTRATSYAIQVVGTNHRQAPVTVRERIAVEADTAAKLMDLAMARCQARECVFLSTCNRVELYYLGPTDDPYPAAARRVIPEITDADDAVGEADLYYYAGEAAVTHLFEVASGLDSMILGEHEVLGQVKDALPRAAASGHAGPVLKRLFHHAVRAGKRARRETAISSGIFSVGQCAARMAEAALGQLHGKCLLLFGAGRIARVTAKHMASLGVKPIRVYSRTRDRAEELAAVVGGEAITAQQVAEALQQADILVGCAAAPHHVVGRDQIEQAMQARGGRTLVVVDLGVPRNVSPGVGEVPGVRLFNIDHLEEVVSRHVGEREAEIKRVRGIVEEEVRSFCQRHGCSPVDEVVPALRQKAEQARQECLRLARRRGMSERDLATADYITDLLVRKLLHGPLVALREASGEEVPRVKDLCATVARLFDLPHPDESSRCTLGADSQEAGGVRDDVKCDVRSEKAQP